MKSGSLRSGSGPGPDRVIPDTAVLIVGEEELLVERAVSAAVSAAGLGPAGQPAPDEPAPDEPAPDGAARAEAAASGGPPDLHDVTASALTAGELTTLTAPSLFGGGCVVLVRSAQDAGKEIASELIRLAESPPPDVTLIVTHSGGGRNKSLVASLVSAGARRVDCPVIKRFGDRMDFLRGEFSRAGRRADDGGLRTLLDAVGTDLRDLAAACSQLAADTTGVIGQETVARYYRGRAEATGFSVADRACEGSLTAALEQLRWALATGTSPVLISSALAAGLRTLGLVGSAGRGLSSNALAADLGIPPWRIDKARQQLRGWSAAGLAAAHAAAAEADAQVKGEAASAGYALERVVTTIVACRAQG